MTKDFFGEFPERHFNAAIAELRKKGEFQAGLSRQRNKKCRGEPVGRLKKASTRGFTRINADDWTDSLAGATPKMSPKTRRVAPTYQ